MTKSNLAKKHTKHMKKKVRRQPDGRFATKVTSEMIAANKRGWEICQGKDCVRMIKPGSSLCNNCLNLAASGRTVPVYDYQKGVNARTTPQALKNSEKVKTLTAAIGVEGVDEVLPSVPVKKVSRKPKKVVHCGLCRRLIMEGHDACLQCFIAAGFDPLKYATSEQPKTRIEMLAIVVANRQALVRDLEETRKARTACAEELGATISVLHETQTHLTQAQIDRDLIRQKFVKQSLVTLMQRNTADAVIATLYKCLTGQVDVLADEISKQTPVAPSSAPSATSSMPATTASESVFVEPVAPAGMPNEN